MDEMSDKIQSFSILKSIILIHQSLPQDLGMDRKIIPSTINWNHMYFHILVLILIFQIPVTIESLARNDQDFPIYKSAGASSGTADSNGIPGTPSPAIDTRLSSPSSSSSSDRTTNDIFGIKKMYPTKSGGREWLINMNDPRSDGIFFITSDQNITQQADGSWRINNTNVRLNVDTPLNTQPWKNVEITGYARIVDKVPIDGNTEAATDDFDLNWLARGGRHSTDTPCEGSALTAILDINGMVGWKKEIW